MTAAAQALLSERVSRTGCTSLTATTCPKCGACQCGPGEWPSGERCPLHAATSRHAELVLDENGRSVGATIEMAETKRSRKRKGRAA